VSIEAMSAVFSMNVGDSTRKLVLLGLANHAHKDGTCAYAGAKLLAEYANCSVRTVQRHIAVLLEDGWIREGDQSVIDPRIPERYRPIAYEIALTDEDREAWKDEREPGRRDQFAGHGQAGGTKAAANRGANLTPLTEAPLDSTGDPVDNRGAKLSPLPDEASGVTPVTPRGDTGDALGVTPMSPKPSIEPNKEPTTPAADASGGRDSSLISNDEGQADGTLALEGVVVEAKVETQREQGYRIVRGYLDWFEKKTGAPIVGKARIVEALRKSYVDVALTDGATEDQIKLALCKSGSEQPPMPQFRRLLREEMGGTNLATVDSRFGPRHSSYSDEVWKDGSSLPAASESEEEAAARAAAWFDQPQQRRTS
jgi:hypothetical protein